MTATKKSAAAFQYIGREQKRRFILTAAAAVFGAKGFHAAAVKDIVRQAGIAHGTFYLYFKDKRDVYLALSHEFQARIMQAILPHGEAGVLKEGVELPALVRESLAGLARLFETEEGLARVFVYRVAGTDQEFEEQRQRFASQITDAVASVMREGAALGLFRRHDPRVVAMCLVGSIEMVIESWLRSAGARGRQSLGHMMEETAGFFLPALLTAKGRGQVGRGGPRATAMRRRKR